MMMDNEITNEMSGWGEVKENLFEFHVYRCKLHSSMLLWNVCHISIVLLIAGMREGKKV